MADDAELTIAGAGLIGMLPAVDLSTIILGLAAILATTIAPVQGSDFLRQDQRRVPQLCFIG